MDVSRARRPRRSVVPFKATVVVSNLPQGFSAIELAALFDAYGLVIDARVDVRTHESGRTLTRGLVALAPPSGVARAIRALDGAPLGTGKLKVRAAEQSRS